MKNVTKKDIAVMMVESRANKERTENILTAVASILSTTMTILSNIDPKLTENLLDQIMETHPEVVRIHEVNEKSVDDEIEKVLEEGIQIVEPLKEAPSLGLV